MIPEFMSKIGRIAQQRIQIVTEENGTMVEKPFDTPAG